MPDLSEIDLKPSYHKGEDDIAGEFYLPCLERATDYDRAVGFFSSSIYVLAWPSLKEFVNRGGHMRIICSPALSSEDREALNRGYSARQEEALAEDLKDSIQDMLDDPVLEKPTKVLASLVAMGVVDFQIAFVGSEPEPRHQRLFHDKLGIFRDAAEGDGEDDVVVFKGSMNETWTGLSADGNLESIDVYVSWGDEREKERVTLESAYFDKLWADDYPSVHVKEFPKVATEELVSAAETDRWETMVDEITHEIQESKKQSPDSGPNPRIPLPHQRQALENWRDRGRRGIFKHATGAGKTFTALCAVREALQNGEIPLIFVPSKQLLGQWKDELQSTNQDLDPKLLVCGGGENQWRKDGLLRSWTRPGDNRRIVLAMMQTGITDDFKALIEDGDHLFFIADEVHRIGSERHRELLSLESGPRLGLSATPERAGDPEGTEAILDYFEGIVQPPFTLKDAIEAGRLTPYFYHVHTVQLTADEQEEWDAETTKIKELYARAHTGDDDPDEEALDRVKHRLIQRARIVKRAEQKVDKAVDIIQEHYETGERWLVYCEGLDQLNAVMDGLRDAGVNALEYHSQMEGNRDQTLRYFRDNGGVVVPIKCLDEGVDIPNATHALILSSSKNPREFIQRRGRVLRTAPNKYLAHVHDIVVIPHVTDPELPSASILEGELGRAIQFGQDAKNPKATADLRGIAVDMGIDFEQVAAEGFEDD